MKKFIDEISKFLGDLTHNLSETKRRKAYLAIRNFTESLSRLEMRFKELIEVEAEICKFSVKKKKRKLENVQMDLLDKTESFHQHVYSTISSFIKVLNLISDHSFRKGLPIKSVQKFLDFILEKNIHPIVERLVDGIRKSVVFRAKFIDHPQQHKAHNWMTYAPNEQVCIIYYVPGDKGPIYTKDNPINPYHPDFQCPAMHESFSVSPNSGETYGTLCTFVHFMISFLLKDKK